MCYRTFIKYSDVPSRLQRQIAAVRNTYPLFNLRWVTISFENGGGIWVVVAPLYLGTITAVDVFPLSRVISGRASTLRFPGYLGQTYPRKFDSESCRMVGTISFQHDMESHLEARPTDRSTPIKEFHVPRLSASSRHVVNPPNPSSTVGASYMKSCPVLRIGSKYWVDGCIVLIARLGQLSWWMEERLKCKQFWKQQFQLPIGNSDQIEYYIVVLCA
ncbi:hypothetical protein C8R43DRAFT_961637 [Mycena crocata]|nr:hypothetical protein C8R43DRAFT_961637 [Mycena crocata]